MEIHSGTIDNYLEFSKTEYGDKEYRNDLKNMRFEFSKL